MSDVEEDREHCAAMAYVGWLGGADDPGRECAYYTLPNSAFCGKHDPRRIAERKNRALSAALGLMDVDALIRNRHVINAIAGFRGNVFRETFPHAARMWVDKRTTRV